MPGCRCHDAVLHDFPSPSHPAIFVFARDSFFHPHARAHPLSCHLFPLGPFSFALSREIHAGRRDTAAWA